MIKFFKLSKLNILQFGPLFNLRPRDSGRFEIFHAYGAETNLQKMSASVWPI